MPEPTPPAHFVITKNRHGKYLVNVQEKRPDGTLAFNSHVGAQHPNKNTAVNRIRTLYGPDAKIEIQL